MTHEAGKIPADPLKAGNQAKLVAWLLFKVHKSQYQESLCISLSVLSPRHKYSGKLAYGSMSKNCPHFDMLMYKAGEGLLGGGRGNSMFFLSLGIIQGSG